MKPTARSVLHRRALRKALRKPRPGAAQLARNEIHADALSWSRRVAEVSDALFQETDELRALHRRLSRPPGGATTNRHVRMTPPR